MEENQKEAPKSTESTESSDPEQVEGYAAVDFLKQQGGAGLQVGGGSGLPSAGQLIGLPPSPERKAG